MKAKKTWLQRGMDMFNTIQHLSGQESWTASELIVQFAPSRDEERRESMREGEEESRGRGGDKEGERRGKGENHQEMEARYLTVMILHEVYGSEPISRP